MNIYLYIYIYIYNLGCPVAEMERFFESKTSPIRPMIRLNRSVLYIYIYIDS